MARTSVTKRLRKAVDHNRSKSKSALPRKSFMLVYKKLNGRTVKRKVDPARLRNGLLTAYDHKRKEVRSFRIDRLIGMKKAAFWGGFDKQASHLAELAGLGALAYPAVQEVRGKKVSDKTRHIAELGGLATLAAPSAYHLGKKLLGK